MEELIDLHNKKNIVILGAGGHAHVIADIISARGDKVVAFLDDNQDAVNRFGSLNDYKKFDDVEYIIGIGDANIRERIVKSFNVKWYTAIHPSAIVSDSSDIGEGTVIMPNAVVNARTKIGKHCIINTGSVVEHDNNISDFAHISVGAKLGGTVSIGQKTWVGIGATVINNVSVCANCVIGAGALVVHDILLSGTYIGVPVKQR